MKRLVGIILAAALTIPVISGSQVQAHTLTSPCGHSSFQEQVPGGGTWYNEFWFEETDAYGHYHHWNHYELLWSSGLQQWFWQYQHNSSHQC